ncbi:flavodoxin family protein [Caloramator proteoclasticus]|uniref:Multimeric flavodoxin WrbA n=1 Tax=Caloramator proteoclasticus DSM 10124 TaxID=1121262 RepID=A0A1M5A117_9CLOT|nr:flavodoxin family protein [Caloramator proteoclasticus]SHF23968.1 Multimeric flavodoxin WrbA [Caloramator proteoclasticus DSM 10124]
MKVVAFNGSPRKEGNTYQAISIVKEELQREGIDVEIVHVGDKLIRGCIACGMCYKNKNERCIIDDEVNDWIQKMKEADGIILGSPVYFSSIAGTMKAFLDRAFYVASANGNFLRHKVGASVVAVRRSGGVSTFNQLNNYINYAEMLMPSTNYWNVIHGAKAGEALQDEEGVQIMRVLGKNMAYLLKLIQNGKDNIEKPEKEKKVYTNFIR